MAHTRGMLQPRVWRPLSRLLGILTILQTCMESDRLAFYVEFLSYCATHTWCMQHRQSMVGAGCKLPERSPPSLEGGKDQETGLSHALEPPRADSMPPNMPLPDQLLI